MGGETEKATPSSGVTIYDVAAEADVSIVTVSRVFNDYPHVSERMRDRVFSAARTVGYAPRLIAKPKLLAVIIGHLDHLSAGDYKTRLLLHIVRAAATRGFLVEFIPYDAVELATKHLVDGVIEVGLTAQDLLDMEHLPSVPMVLTNKDRVRPDWNTVSSDHYEEVQLATAHLSEYGHRKVALVLDERRGWGVEERCRAYTDFLAETRGAPRDPAVYYAAEQSPREITRKMLDAGCTACVNFTDNFGFAILDCLTNELGLAVPDDISVVCLENATVSEFLHPRLTTIEQPLQSIAEEAVQGIGAVIKGEKKRFAKLLHSRLVPRDSVKRLI